MTEKTEKGLKPSFSERKAVFSMIVDGQVARIKEETDIWLNAVLAGIEKEKAQTTQDHEKRIYEIAEKALRNAFAGKIEALQRSFKFNKSMIEKHPGDQNIRANSIKMFHSEAIHNTKITYVESIYSPIPLAEVQKLEAQLAELATELEEKLAPAL